LTSIYALKLASANRSSSSSKIYSSQLYFGGQTSAGLSPTGSEWVESFGLFSPVQCCSSLVWLGRTQPSRQVQVKNEITT